MDQYLLYTIFSGIFTSINPSYVDVHQGFYQLFTSYLPAVYQLFPSIHKVLTHPHIPKDFLFQAAEWLAGADALLIGSGVGGAQCIDMWGFSRHGVAIVMGGSPKFEMVAIYGMDFFGEVVNSG